MIAALVLIAGNADWTAIVQTPVVALYPGSVVGMLNPIVFVVPTAPLTCACSCVLSDETASVPFETSIACAQRQGRIRSRIVGRRIHGDRRQELAILEHLELHFFYVVTSDTNETRMATLSGLGRGWLRSKW